MIVRLKNQEAEGRPEQDLGDEDSNLNFTANLTSLLKRVSLHDKLLKGLCAPVLETVAFKFIAMLLGNEATEATGSGRFAATLCKKEELAESVGAVLKAAGSSQTAVGFAESMDQVYCQDERQHLITKDRLRKELKKLHDARVHELMAEEMPDACLIVAHFDIFFQLLH
ncbi:hypothetical protein GPECTOR_1692g809 [Gonium pectorale]|uniref:Uncharacterized protein n=1 Tax=Gonium pectorale TaxID=33097 RepID=A0A150FTD9_GONPE|nr:hypothetical protein GPECTOR_1692g809 [Gonium pectorale]|eukprot:KXZ40869.1 hypothetical protein GPECTOR_1692g809 [Gonium pectorale]